MAKKAKRTQKVVAAETFVLLDDRGKTRAILGTHTGGDPHLDMFDEGGVHKISVGLAQNSAHIALVRKDGQFLAGIQVFDDNGRVALFLSDDEGTRKFVAGFVDPVRPNTTFSMRVDETRVLT